MNSLIGPRHLILGFSILLGGVGEGQAQFADWKHSSSLPVLTTPEGANLPKSTVIRDFPLLVRLHRDFFPFAEAAVEGRDLRFSAAGQPLFHERDSWDPAAGEASFWVRLPLIRGDEIQEIRVHWGKADAPDASNGQAVFNETNGYIGVWHLGADVQPAFGSFEMEDKRTTAVKGMIGDSRLFANGNGICCGKKLENLPVGGDPHSTQAWIRPDSSGGRVLGWGKEKGQGKVTMLYQSPPGIRMDCYFSNGDVQAEIPKRAGEWTHVFHTFEEGRSILYIDGVKQGEGVPRHASLAIERPAGMWIGGWHDRYDFDGSIDEVRLSSVARSPEWIHLEYENQKAIQTVTGPLVQDGSALSVSPPVLRIKEGETAQLQAVAGGAKKVYWTQVRGGGETRLAADRFRLDFAAGRVKSDQVFKLRLDAVYENGIRSQEIPVTVLEAIPEPVFALNAPEKWNGRDQLEIRPDITNLAEMQKAGGGDLDYRWELEGLATLNSREPGRLILERAQNSGRLKLRLLLSNGGDPTSRETEIEVQEPDIDPWVPWTPGKNEMPREGQFYARDDQGEGTLHCRGTLDARVDSVFLRVFSDDAKYAEENQVPDADGSYVFGIRLRSGLTKYRVEFGTKIGGVETILHRAGEILCGDAFLINGQSNALATDTREDAARETNPWVRSYGNFRHFKQGERENLWCQPVWKAQKEHLAELGWWGMELAKSLVESRQIPVCLINAARGGTRIDQHQRDDANPADPSTLYGEMLWRIREAQLTHGIRAIIWHQGENDQGAAGPDGGYGWESYQRYFGEMAADWKRDFPNVSRFYLFQIWPSACSMGRDGHGDRLREKQRTLPFLYSNLDILSTLDIRPGGSCHYPLEGWGRFARRLQPLIERDFHGIPASAVLTAPNLLRARFADPTRSSLVLEFDQPILWDPQLVSQFYLEDSESTVTGGESEGSILNLQLSEPLEKAAHLTYLKEKSWSQDHLLMGANGIAALTFSEVPIASFVEEPK